MRSNKLKNKYGIICLLLTGLCILYNNKKYFYICMSLSGLYVLYNNKKGFYIGMPVASLCASPYAFISNF